MSLLQNYTMMKLPKASGGLLLRTPTSTLGFSSRSALSNTLMSRAFSTSPNEKPERSTTFSKPSDVGMFWTRRLSADSDKQKPVGTSRRYHWVEEEATQLIAQAYKIHLPSHPFPPSVGFDRKRLEELKSLPHLVPTTFSDKVALKIVSLLESVMHMFFRKKYDHHAVTLETVAAVPGMVAGMHRHMRSLRKMTDDHGWIDKMLEESVNERMHLYVWLQHTQPNAIERMFVLVAQAMYTAAYSTLYVISPKTAHRTVGYLEESAFRAYTDYLASVDSGEIPNVVLPENSIGKRFYRLPDGSTLRDVILHVRADEAFHALYNHGLSTQIAEGGIDKESIDLHEDSVQGEPLVQDPKSANTVNQASLANSRMVEEVRAKATQKQ